MESISRFFFDPTQLAGSGSERIRKFRVVNSIRLSSSLKTFTVNLIIIINNCLIKLGLTRDTVYLEKEDDSNTDGRTDAERLQARHYLQHALVDVLLCVQEKVTHLI